MIPVGWLRPPEPVATLLMAVVAVGSVLNGLAWRPAEPYDVVDAVTHPSWPRAAAAVLLPFYCHTAGELVFTLAALNTCGRRLERTWGSPRTAGYVLAALACGVTVRLWLMRLFADHTALLPGPHIVVAAVAYAAALHAPRAVMFTAWGIPVYTHTPSLLFTLQLAAIHGADSILMCLAGAIGGAIVCSTPYRLLPLPSLQSRLRHLLPHRQPKVTLLTPQTAMMRLPAADL